MAGVLIPIGGAAAAAPCQAGLLGLIIARLRPLQTVLKMRDTDRVKNTLQLRLCLIVQVASSILSYWVGSMPTPHTAAACMYSDCTISDAVANIAACCDSPAERAALALLIAKLPAKIGGLGTSNYAATADAIFTATFRPCWTACRAANTDLAALSLSEPDADTTIAAFNASYAAVLSTEAHVRRLHAENASADNLIHWVDGTTHLPFLPALACKRGAQLPTSPAALFDGAVCIPASRFSQRALTAVFNNKAWIEAKAACDAFDSANADACVPHREGARLVSYSQEGSAWALARLPDLTLPSSIHSTNNTRAIIQRKLGLYISSLVTPLTAKAVNAGHLPTQYQLLGDAAINDANNSTRHKCALYALYNALRAVVPPASPPARVQLCDRGDGTRESKEACKKRWAFLNSTHVPDVAVFTVPPTLYEFKSYTWANQKVALGHGTARTGGKPSTAEGHLTAFGGTEEDLRRANLGVAQRGHATDEPHERSTGKGYVAPHVGLYGDALGKGHDLSLCITETSGAANAVLVALLRHLARCAAAKGATDSTRYGHGRAATRSFYSHHLAEISTAVQLEDANTLNNIAAASTFALAFGVT